MKISCWSFRKQQTVLRYLESRALRLSTDKCGGSRVDGKVQGTEGCTGVNWFDRDLWSWIQEPVDMCTLIRLMSPRLAYFFGFCLLRSNHGVERRSLLDGGLTPAPLGYQGVKVFQ